MQDSTRGRYWIFLLPQPSAFKGLWLCPMGKPKWNISLELGQKRLIIFPFCFVYFFLFFFYLKDRCYIISPPRNAQRHLRGY